MQPNNDHRAYMAFLAKVTALLADYSRENLAHFKTFADVSFPAMADLIAACMRVAERVPRGSASVAETKRPVGQDATPLIDLLCSSTLFPSNSDLVVFATRALPGINKRGLTGRSRRFVAERVMSHLEKINGGKREQLEQSMREAMNATKSSSKKPEPQSFFGQWEKIIKGMGR